MMRKTGTALEDGVFLPDRMLQHSQIMGGGQSDSRQALVKLKIPSQELCFMKCYLRTKEKRCVLLI